MNKKQKGRKLVIKIIEEFRNRLDKSTYEVSGSGAGMDKGDIRVPSCDLVIEAKNHEQIRMAQWTKQADREGLGHSKTALAWRHPDSSQANPEIRIDISLEFFIDLLQHYKEPVLKELDQNMKWKIQRMVDSAKAVLKELNYKI